ncbi:MAG: GntR family transcriptional regulator [Actinomycetota bacterium]|nr:GntR family transcriptional regulator [Actinomycetota bacterium]MDA8207402.1 GntR family transcriptional regulator [Actinomycetota bacterium]
MATTRRLPSDLGLTTAAARVIFSPDDDSAGRVEMAVRRLSEAIRLGLLLDGERLPAEATLAEQMGVATVTLREALALLREQGMIETRRGRRGGNFVTSPRNQAAGLYARLNEFSTEALRDLGDHRSAVAGTAAKLAAERAVDGELEGLAQRLERFRQAGTVSELRRADAEFSLAVAAAAQSPRLAVQELRLRAEIGDLLWLDLNDGAQQHAWSLRAAMLEAIKGRDPATASELAERSVTFDTRRLVELRIQGYRLAPAPGKGVRA